MGFWCYLINLAVYSQKLEASGFSCSRILIGKAQLQIKLKCLSMKSMNMCIWEIGTLNQLFIRGSYTEIKFPRKWNSSKSGFFVNSFCAPHSLCLNIRMCRSVLYGNVALSIVVLSTKKRYSGFSEKVFVFQKTCFKVKTLKTFKISSDCHMKICRSWKRRGILQIPSTVF